MLLVNAQCNSRTQQHTSNSTEEAGSKAAKKQKSTTELSFQAAPLPRPPKANEGKIIGVKRERVSTHKDLPPEGVQGNEPNAHQRDRNHALGEEDGASCTYDNSSEKPGK